jgi:hypothetical protein
MTHFAAQASAVSAIILLVIYLFGVTFGMVGSAVLGSLRENRRMSLLEQAPDPISAGARVFFNLVTRDDDGYMKSLRPGARKAVRDPHADGSSGSHGQGLDR